MKAIFYSGLLVTALAALPCAQAEENGMNIEAVKSTILTMAESFAGQGDADFSKQKALQVYVDKLLQLAPSKPISQRLRILAGAWKQVWGPYDYRNDDRGIDPELVTDSIYQVVFPEGY